MQPSLLIIGLSHRITPIAIRERFWVGESRESEILHQLVRSDGIDEAIVLANCNRTELILWATDPPEAANSVLRLLTREYQLKLHEWTHFFRLLDEAALLHLFRVTSGLEAMVPGDPEVLSDCKRAWQKAQTCGTAGPFLDAVMQKAITVAARVWTDTSITDQSGCIASAVTALATPFLESLEHKTIAIVGTGRMGDRCLRSFTRDETIKLKVLSRKATSLRNAPPASVQFVEFADRWEHFAEADVIITCTTCPHALLTHGDVERLLTLRAGRPTVIADLGLPRNVDPTVSSCPGLLFFNVDDVSRWIRSSGTATPADAEEFVAREAAQFEHTLSENHAVPAVAAVKDEVKEICDRELRNLRDEMGPFAEDQDEVLERFAGHLAQRIASRFAGGLNAVPARREAHRSSDRKEAAKENARV